MGKTTYEVVGAQPVYDTPPGGQFTVEMDPVQEQRLVEGGAIKVVSGEGAGPKFASAQAEEAAEAAGLNDEQVAAIEGSGSGGAITVDDVKAVTPG